MPPPIRTDAPQHSPAFANWAAMAALVAGFAVQRSIPDLGEAWTLNSRDPRLPQFLAYAFLHLNWLHLAGNLLAMAIFGGKVSDRLGTVGYVSFFLAGAVVAGAAFVLSSDGGAVIGASGAASAVMGAYLALWPRSRIIFSVSLLFPSGTRSFEVPAMPFIIVYFLFNVAMALDPSTGVAYTAHIAGMAFGLSVCTILLGMRLIDRNGADLVSLIQHRRRRHHYQALVREGYDPFGKPRDERKA